MKQNFLASSHRIQLILDSFRGQIPSGSRILDVGCGNGLISKILAENFQASVVGTDVDPFLKYDIPFMTIEEAFACRDGEFDVVTLVDVLHHVKPESQLATIKEATRIGKRVLIFDTRPTVLAKVLDVVMGWVVYQGKEKVPLSHRSPEDWRGMLETLDFPYSLREPSHPFYYPLRHFAFTINSECPQTAGVVQGREARNAR